MPRLLPRNDASLPLALLLSALGLAVTACGGGRIEDLAEGVRRAAAVRERQEEIDESVVGLRRRECQRYPTNPGCADLLSPQQAPRSRGVAPLVRAVASEGTEVGGRFGAGNLLRDDGPEVQVGWRSTSAALPQELTFELRQEALLDRVAFRQTQASVPESWAREVELLLSDAGPDSGFASAGRWVLRQAVAPHQFSFRPLLARYARVRVHSRHGDADFVSLGALALGMNATDQLPLLLGG
ncbi:MAG: hypothetical protein ACR2NO_12700 [Chloroflexota bacterium]